MVIEVATRFAVVAGHFGVLERARRAVHHIAPVRRHTGASHVTSIRVHAVGVRDVEAALARTSATLLALLTVVALARALPSAARRLQVHATIVVVRRRELHFLILELLLDELFRVAQLRQLYFFLLDDERWEAPFSALLVPLRLLLDLVHLLVGHEETRHLIQEVELLGLLTNCIQ